MTPQVISAENALLIEQERNRLYPEVHFGSHVFVGRNVTIGSGSIIGHNVVLHDDCTIGNEVRIDDGSIIGKLPLRSRMSAVTRDVSLSPACLGDGCLVGSNAIVYRGARIGDGVLIADLASVREETVIGELSIIGRCCKIETGAYITAKTTIGDLCFIAPEVTFTNDNFVGRTQERFKHFGGGILERGARIGANATILPGVTIGADALIGAGSVVTHNVPPETVVIGAPAKPRRRVSPDQLLPPVSALPGKSGAE